MNPLVKSCLKWSGKGKFSLSALHPLECSGFEVSFLNQVDFLVIEQHQTSSTGEALLSSNKQNHFRFQPVPVFECNLAGLQTAYQGGFNYEKDGLLFYNKASHYTRGLTPLVLAWRDPKTSRFTVDTPDGVNPFPIQSCVLRLKTLGDKYALVAHGGDIVAYVQPCVSWISKVKPGTIYIYKASIF